MQTIFGLSAHFLAAKTSPPYMHTARRKKRSFTRSSARNLSTFFGDVFSQDKENKRRRTSVLQAKFDAVLRKLSPKPQIIFRRCFFRKTRKMSADVQAYSERNLTPYSGNSARNLKSFFGDVFSQDKENERRRTSVLRVKFDAVFGKLSPKPQIIFR